MVDQELMAAVADAINAHGGVESVPADHAQQQLARLAEVFVKDDSAIRWWEHLREPSRRIDYGDGDGLSIVDELVGADEECLLVVTDDTEPPWPMFQGRCRKIVAVLRDCPFFEYFLASRQARWIVFDTHHNELVALGELPNETPSM